MRLTKFITLVLFAFISMSLNAQDAYKKNDYIKNGIKYLNLKLEQANTSQLSDDQIIRIEKILAEKEIKWKHLTSQKLDKDKMSNEMKKIEKEYAPQIDAVLSNEQRIAMAKVKTIN